MDTAKLEAALVDLKLKRDILDRVIQGLQTAIHTLSGGSADHQSLIDAATKASRNSDGKAKATSLSPVGNDSASYIEDAAEIYLEAGKPMHVSWLAERISEKRGTTVPRGSFEGSITRHVKRAKQPKLAKFGPSIYGLAEWKTKPPALFSNESAA